MKTITLILIVTTCALFAQEAKIVSTASTSQPTTQPSESDKVVEVDIKKLKNKLKHEAEVAHSKERVPLLLAKNRIELKIATLTKAKENSVKIMEKEKKKINKRKSSSDVKYKEERLKIKKFDADLSELNKQLDFAQKNLDEHNRLEPGVSYFKKLSNNIKDGEYGQILGGFYNVVDVDKGIATIDMPIKVKKLRARTGITEYKDTVFYEYKRVKLYTKGVNMSKGQKINTQLVYKVIEKDNEIYLEAVSF